MNYLFVQDEDYREKYGGITDVLSSRRENSIIVLCDAIHRMKKELDEKDKCAKLLEDVAGNIQYITLSDMLLC